MVKVRREALLRRWVHAYEEDRDDRIVFRPAEHELPPSRGRMAFELRPDGTFAESGLGPADVPEEASGTWELDDGERIVLSEGAAQGVPRVLKIVSCDEDRLVIKR
jgi:hypothetical protein